MIISQFSFKGNVRYPLPNLHPFFGGGGKKHNFVKIFVVRFQLFWNYVKFKVVLIVFLASWL